MELKDLQEFPQAIKGKQLLALKKFLRPWLQQKELIGIILSGSSIYGTADRFSDIDVHLIMSNDVKRRTIGNCKIDGVAFEYFVNPLRQLYAYNRQDLGHRSHCNANMISLGYLLYAKNKSILKLVADCRRLVRSAMPPISYRDKKFTLHQLWDCLDEIRSSWQRDVADFRYTAWHGLHCALESHALLLRYELPAIGKRLRVLRNSGFAHKYALQDFPDRRFVQLFSAALKSTSLKTIESLIIHVLDYHGGIKIENWRLTSPLDL